MSEQEKSKSKRVRWLRVGFVVLVLVVGLGPLLMLLAYTRDINLIQFLQRRPEQKVETAPEQLPQKMYTVQYMYRFCDHSSVYDLDSTPADMEIPPADLVEVAAALHESDAGVENIVPYFKDSGWYVADAGAGPEGPCFIFTHLEDLCPDCRGHYYLGIFHDGTADMIAVFEGRPPCGKVIKVTPHAVRDDDREGLEAGEPLDSLDDLESALEAYTS